MFSFEVAKYGFAFKDKNNISSVRKLKNKHFGKPRKMQ